VRRVLGSVPRQNCCMGFGPLAMERMVPRSVLERDCWTLVFKRSAGCRRTAERTPELRPAKKWTVCGCQFECVEMSSLVGKAYKKTRHATAVHLTFPDLHAIDGYDL
jgi:hypothetical protein